MRHWLKGSGVGVRIAAKINDTSSAHLRYRLRKGASTHPSFAMRVMASGTSKINPNIIKNHRANPTYCAMEIWGMKPAVTPYEIKKFSANGSTKKKEKPTPA